jgi:hypothetical protein
MHVKQCTHDIDAYGWLDGGWEPKHTQQDWIELAFSLSLNWTQHKVYIIHLLNPQASFLRLIPALGVELGLKESHTMAPHGRSWLRPREYLMYYRRPGSYGSFPPFFGQQVISLSQSFCVSPFELTDGRVGKGGERSQITSLVLYNQLTTLS